MMRGDFQNPASQAEKAAMLREERRLRASDHEPTTLHQMASVGLSLEGGRFVSKDIIISGSEASVRYPAASGPWAAGPQPGLEPPTGIDVNAMEPVGTSAEIAASLEALAEEAPVGSASVGAEPADPAVPVVDRGSANSEAAHDRLRQLLVSGGLVRRTGPQVKRRRATVASSKQNSPEAALAQCTKLSPNSASAVG
jgi:hypothetical protein